ncbi:hematopoietic prostaglandin D synthase-like, partial [Scyliorhinus torazame]|uniref:hematopoietic prostaglandin D synthase-like n=1 Tax=Scyliorhinus torazame TaxID=75743 RepID=UPI003B5C3EC5
MGLGGGGRGQSGHAEINTFCRALIFKQIPVLNVDNIIINQSSAIARYLARETGLAGKSNLEQARVDAIVDTINDFMNMFPWTEKNQVVK